MTVRNRTITFAADGRAATAIEFALLAPVFLSMMFGIIEGSRFLWIRQSLTEVAFSTARCTSVSTDCDTPTHRAAFATARAQSYGQALTAADIDVTSNTVCNTAPGMVKVMLSTRFDSPAAGLLPAMPTEVHGIGCYPVLKS